MDIHHPHFLGSLLVSTRKFSSSPRKVHDPDTTGLKAQVFGATTLLENLKCALLGIPEVNATAGSKLRPAWSPLMQHPAFQGQKSHCEHSITLKYSH